MSRRRRLFLLFSLLVFAAGSVFALEEDGPGALSPIQVEKMGPPEPQAKAPSEEGSAKYSPQATAMLLNYCRESLYKVVEFNDRTVLDDEYSKLVNNIDITRIQDDEAAQLIETLLTQLNALKLNEAERKFLNDAYNRKIQSAVLEVFKGGRGADTKEVKNLLRPLGQPAALACDAIVRIAAGIASYKSAVARTQREVKMRMLQLQAEELNRLTVLRTKFFDTEYKLYKRYTLPDRLNLKEVQLAQYIKILADDDSRRRLERLDRLKSDFDAFPPFWYQIGKAAQDAGNATIAKSYYNHFEQIQMRVFREDQDYVMLCMHRVLLLEPKNDPQAIRHDLRTIEENTRYYYKWENILFAALMYYQIHDLENARRLIRTSINEGCCVGMHEQVMTQMESTVARAELAQQAADIVANKDLSAIDAMRKVGPAQDLDMLRAMGKMLLDIDVSVEARSHAGETASYFIPGYNVYAAGRALVKGDAYYDNCIVRMPKEWYEKEGPGARLEFKGRTFKTGSVEKEPKTGFVRLSFPRVLKQSDVVEKKQQFPLTLHMAGKTAVIDMDYDIRPVTPQLLKRRPELPPDAPYFELRAIRFKDRTYKIIDGLITYESP